MLKYHNISKHDMLNGDGIRVVLWVSGCEHHCKGCQNPLTWNPNHGLEFDGRAEDEILLELGEDYVSGLTLSGGDPLYPANRPQILDLVKKVKFLYPEKTIWLYTGYTYEDIADLEILKYIDVLVDGKYERDLPPADWVGSNNQRVIRLCK